jgi:hypothetical protein
MTDWPKRADGTNKTIGEMTEEERRPILRAAYLRSKLAALMPATRDAFKEPTIGN